MNFQHNVTLKTRSHLSCSNILALLVPRFTRSGVRKIAAQDLSWPTQTPRSILWFPPLIASFSPSGLKSLTRPRAFPSLATSLAVDQACDRRQSACSWTHYSLHVVESTMSPDPSHPFDCRVAAPVASSRFLSVL